MSLYCFACGHISVAFQLLYRARYIAVLCHGEFHPETAQIDVNIALMLHAVEEFDTAALFLDNALKLNKVYVFNFSVYLCMWVRSLAGSLVYPFCIPCLNAACSNACFLQFKSRLHC